MNLFLLRLPSQVFCSAAVARNGSKGQTCSLAQRDFYAHTVTKYVKVQSQHWIFALECKIYSVYDNLIMLINEYVASL